MNLVSTVKDDPPLIFLLVANLFTLVLALVQGWNFATLLWLYWIQSIIIGVFTFLKLYTYKSTLVKSIHDTPPDLGSVFPAKVGSMVLGVFFLFHYGIFHLVYFFFLVVIGFMTKMPRGDISWVVLTGCAFLLTHTYSYYRNRERDQEQPPMRIMFTAYTRILPMHLIIIFGTPIYMVSSRGKVLVLILFVIFKTIADVLMHVKTHKDVSMTKKQ